MPKNPILVYIVDNDPAVCTGYARLLRSARITTRIFRSVEELIGLGLSGNADCVISDIHMLGCSGLELPRLLAGAGRPWPVIYVSAHDTQEIRELARRAGAAGYFRKPVDDQALLDAIAWAMV